MAASPMKKACVGGHDRLILSQTCSGSAWVPPDLASGLTRAPKRRCSEVGLKHRIWPAWSVTRNEGAACLGICMLRRAWPSDLRPVLTRIHVARPCEWSDKMLRLNNRKPSETRLEHRIRPDYPEAFNP